jgi:tRNA nucleotidyltransferase/poly(A) polymerase
MPEDVKLPFPEILEQVRQLARNSPPIYLVGGAIRDLFLDRATHDLDFVMEGDARPIARALSNVLNADFYILDPERNTARVIFKSSTETCDIDFASLKPGGIEADLMARDFTVNAIAIDMTNARKIIDPLGGAGDLQARKLKACSVDAFKDDPIRLLRGVRLSQSLGFMIEKSSLQVMKEAAPRIVDVSSERIRDELFKILDTDRAAGSIRVLDHLGILDKIFPELCILKGVNQPAPHLLDVWEHTIAVLNELEWVFNLLIKDHHGKTADNRKMASAVIKLGKFKPGFQQHIVRGINPNRSIRSLLFFSALFHDAGKPPNFSRGSDGRIHFYDHERESTALAIKYARQLAFSQAETQLVSTIINNHMRIHSLVKAGNLPSDRAIYRFFRSTGDAGVEVCLLSLADTLATYGVTLPEHLWDLQLDICECLLSAWWERKDQVIEPPVILNGTDLQNEFNLQPGPIIGDLLDALRESQAAGKIITRDDAIIYSKLWLEEPDGHE